MKNWSSYMKKLEVRSILQTGEQQLRSDSEDSYIFSGYAVTWGTLDSKGSTFKRGCFKKTLQERESRIKILWNHNVDEPIGKPLQIREDKTGLFVRGQLTKGVTRADDVFLNLKAKVIDTLSFGFQTVKDQITNGVRNISEVKLYEVSPVTFEANSTAKILDVRSSDFEETYNEAELHQKGSFLIDALLGSLWSVWYEGDKDTVIGLADKAISDFHSAYILWAQDYINEFWEERKAALAQNALSKAFHLEVTETAKDLASRTSFTVAELENLSNGIILPIESRTKLAELPQVIGETHKEERSKAVETLCNELRSGGFSDAESTRFVSLLTNAKKVSAIKTVNGEDLDTIFSVLEKFRK